MTDRAGVSVYEGQEGSSVYEMDNFKDWLTRCTGDFVFLDVQELQPHTWREGFVLDKALGLFSTTWLVEWLAKRTVNGYRYDWC